MAVSCSHYDTDRFGAALPRFTPRQADLLWVVGTITHKQAPVLLRVYEQMTEPKWVVAMGACTSALPVLALGVAVHGIAIGAAAAVMIATAAETDALALSDSIQNARRSTACLV